MIPTQAGGKVTDYAGPVVIPSVPRRFLKSPGLWILGLTALGLALLLAVYWAVPRQPRRILLLLEPSVLWSGVTENQRLGVMTLLKDNMEVDAGWVVQDSQVELVHPQAEVEVLRLRAQRMGDQLRLGGQWTRPGSATVTLDSGFVEPALAVRQLLRSMGHRGSHHPALFPRFARNYFLLAELTGWSLDAQMEPAFRLGEELLKAEPECANVHLGLGELRARYLVQRSVGDLATQNAVEVQFKEALKRCPGHPRAQYGLVRIQVDRARQRECLDLLEKALEAHPHSPQLYGALAYAARTSGLLDLAIRAERRRVHLVGSDAPQFRRMENTHFYLGDWRAFEATLNPPGEEVVTPLRDFYRGYTRLCLKDPAKALAYFRRATRESNQFLQFYALARVYRCGLENRPEEALALLRELRQQRAQLRIPDGEYTFKLAEAFAFLGQTEEAVDTAQRAFGQGFGCTRYYQASPLLANLQNHPRYQALLGHLRERQQLLEERYPARRFGL